MAAVQLERYLRHVSIERGLAANTVEAYRRDLGAYLHWLNDRDIPVGLGDVTGVTLTAYVAELGGRSPAPSAATVARALSSVRGFHRFLHEEGVTPGDPGEPLRPPKIDGRLPKPLPVDDVSRLLAAAAGDGIRELRDAALLEFLYATGARVSEAVGLDVDDRLDDGLVRLRGKGNKERIVPVGSYAITALDAYLVRARPTLAARGPATPALFLGIRGQRVSRQNAWLIIKAAAERAGITADVSPHSLRHSFATHLLQGGADVRVVQELLGHSSVATTQIYTLVTVDALRDVYSTSHPRAR